MNDRFAVVRSHLESIDREVKESEERLLDALRIYREALQKIVGILPDNQGNGFKLITAIAQKALDDVQL